MPTYGNPSFVVTKVVHTCQQIIDGGQAWPERTDLACLWCEHTFDWAPVGAPVRHNPKKDVFTLKWNFCSFNCCKAWMLDRRLPSVSNIYWLATRLFGMRTEHRQRLEGITPAPCKEALQKYGGWMTIERFRSNDTLIRPANTQGINVVWDPMEVAVDEVDGEPQLAAPSRVGLPHRSGSGSSPLPPLPRPKPPTAPKPNSLDEFLKGGSKQAVIQKPKQAPKRSRKIAPMSSKKA